MFASTSDTVITTRSPHSSKKKSMRPPPNLMFHATTRSFDGAGSAGGRTCDARKIGASSVASSKPFASGSHASAAATSQIQRLVMPDRMIS